jgi:hypothetical protein
MALTLTELEATTKDYFLADNRKAIDIYFNDSFYMDYSMNKKKAILKRYPGGKKIKCHLNYDGQEGGFYDKNSTLSSDDKESVNAAFFSTKHAYGNATIHRNDELENAGAYAEVELVATKLEGAQKTCRKKIAQQIYANNGDGAKEITGIKAMCFGAAATAYGEIAENDLASADGTKPWKAVNTTAAAAISLSAIRTLKSSAKISDGPNGKPNVGLTTEALFNIVSSILQNQQRFTQDSETVKAGFTNLVFEGMIIAADDYCPTGYLYLLNTAYCGWAIHTQGFFARTQWADLLPTGTPAKSLKIFWDGNHICTNRKAHAGQSGLT